MKKAHLRACCIAYRKLCWAMQKATNRAFCMQCRKLLDKLSSLLSFCITFFLHCGEKCLSHLSYLLSWIHLQYGAKRGCNGRLHLVHAIHYIVAVHRLQPLVLGCGDHGRRLSKRPRHKQLGVSKALAVGQVASCLCQPTLAVLLLQLPLQLMWAVPQTPRAQEGDDTLVTGISEMTVIWNNAYSKNFLLVKLIFITKIV